MATEPQHEPPFDASNPEQVSKRTARAKGREESIFRGLGDCLSTRQGRDFIWDLLGQCGVFQSSFTGNASTFFHEGRRDIGLRIMAKVTKRFPTRLVEMMTENGENNG